MIKRIRAVVKGRVQGVGFRYFTRDRAERHGLSGSVRNLPGGDVELEAQGAAEALKAFTEEIKEGPGLSHVSDMTINDLPLEKGETEFVIRH